MKYNTKRSNSPSSSSSSLFLEDNIEEVPSLRKAIMIDKWMENRSNSSRRSRHLNLNSSSSNFSCGGKVGFGAEDNGGHLPASFVKSVEEILYNISVIQISSILPSPEVEAPAPEADSPKSSKKALKSSRALTHGTSTYSPVKSKSSRKSMFPVSKSSKSFRFRNPRKFFRIQTPSRAISLKPNLSHRSSSP
ncbi:hypothetical protein LguiA_015738 [Lonicera macranthoides]